MDLLEETLKGVGLHQRMVGGSPIVFFLDNIQERYVSMIHSSMVIEGVVDTHDRAVQYSIYGTFIDDEYFRHIKHRASVAIADVEGGDIVSPNIPIPFAEFGPQGPKSKIDACTAQLFTAMSVGRHMVVARLPNDFVDSDRFKQFQSLLVNYPLMFRNDGPFNTVFVWVPAYGGREVRPIYLTLANERTITSALEASNWGDILDHVKGKMLMYNRGLLPLVKQPKPMAPIKLPKRIAPPKMVDTVRIACDGNGGGVTLIGLTPQSKIQLAIAYRESGLRLRKSTRQYVMHQLGYLIKARYLVEDGGLDSIIEYLRQFGLKVVVDRQVYNWLEGMKRKKTKADTCFEQQILVESTGSWIEENELTGLRTVYKDEYNGWVKKIQREITFPLYGYQVDDIARLLTKGSGVLAADMGYGKTRVLLALSLLSGKRHLAVLESKLIRELLAEAKSLNIPLTHIKEIKTEDDLKDLATLNIITYGRVWRQVGDRMRTKMEEQECYFVDVKLVNMDTGEVGWREIPVNKSKGRYSYSPLPEGYDWPVNEITGDLDKPELKRRNINTRMELVEVETRPAKTLAHLLRKIRFNTLILDEAHKIKGGKTTKQGEYIHLLRAKHVVEMTGTVVPSYPRNIYALLVRAFGQHTVSCRWGYDFPIQHPEEKFMVSPTRIFADKYVQIMYMSDEFADSLNKGRKSREIPMVPEHSLPDWYRMLSKSVLRRSKEEPAVSSCVRIPTGQIEEVFFDCDEQLSEFYLWWLDEFARWFEEELAKERDGGKFNSSGLLAILNKLRFAAVVPQSEKVQIPGVIEWGGGLTPRQQGIFDGIMDLYHEQKKTILISESPELLLVMGRELEKEDVKCMEFHGGIDMKTRLDNLDTFRTDKDYTVLLMSRGCGQTGYNIPQADVIWNADWNWTPGDMLQAEARMLRSSWYTQSRIDANAVPMIYRTVQSGTIDEYMRQLVNLKAEGIGQSIDRSAVEFDLSNFKSYREFSMEMLKDSGRL